MNEQFEVKGNDSRRLWSLLYEESYVSLPKLYGQDVSFTAHARQGTLDRVVNIACDNRLKVTITSKGKQLFPVAQMAQNPQVAKAA